MSRPKYQCANCTQPFSLRNRGSSSNKNDSTEVPIIVREIAVDMRLVERNSNKRKRQSSSSSWSSRMQNQKNQKFNLNSGSDEEVEEIIKVPAALSSIYKLDYVNDLPELSNKFMAEEDYGNIALCGPCARVLTNLYNFYMEFNQMRTVDSFIARRIDVLDKILQQLLGNWNEMLHNSSDDDNQASSPVKNVGAKTSVKDHPPPIKIFKSSNDHDLPIPRVKLQKLKAQDIPNNSKIKSDRTKLSTKSNVEVNSIEEEENNDLLDEDYDPSAHNTNDDDGISTDDDAAAVGNEEKNLDGTISQSSACPLCQSKFSSLAQLSLHLLRGHASKTSNDCPICQNTFTARGTLRVHLRSHVGYKAFLCSVCSKTFVRSGDLRRHEQSHKIESLSKESGHTCVVCDETFDTKSLLNEHQKEQHPNEVLQVYSGIERKVEINEEGQESLTSSSKINNNDKVHPVDPDLSPQPTIDDKADENGDDDDVGGKEMIPTIYASSVVLQCDQCLKKFIYVKSFETHQAVCPMRKKKEVTDRSGQTRKVKSSGSKKKSSLYECKVCHKQFQGTYYLQRHFVIHSDSKQPYKCPICNKKFSQAAHRNRHAKLCNK